MIFKQQLTDISTVLNNTGNTTKLLTSFNALDIAQQKVLLSSSLLSEKQKEQCITMATLSAANTKYTAEQLVKATGISTETLANWGLIESTDALTISELAQRAASDAQAKAVLDKIIAQNAEAVANGKIIASNTALTASEGGATLATGTFTTAIKANIKAMITWMTTTPLGWLTMLVGGVFLAVKAYDALTISVKEQKEKMEDSLSAYKDAKSELSNITTELENQEQAMDDLLTKEKLTYAEQGQLVELQAITRELRIQKDLAEKEEGRTQKEVAKDASDLFNKQFGNYDISENAINEYQNNANITGNNAILVSDEDNISSMIAGYRQFNDLLDEAYGSESQEDIDHFKSLTEGLKDSIFETAQELQEQQSNIADYYNTIKDIPYDDLTTEQKGIVDSYNSISDAIELIYQQLDSNTWKTMQIESVFDTEGIEKTKEELIEMVKAGEFDESTLQSYPKLSDALEQNKVSASELRNELEALAEAEDNVKGDTFNDETPTPLSISDTVDQLNTQLKPAFDSLKSAYQNIFTDDGKFALNSIDILSTCDTIKSKLDEMSDPEGLNLDVDYSAYEDFVRVLSDTESTEQDVEKAMDFLADSITQAALSGSEDFETMKAALEDLGVVNNEMVAFQALINNTTALEEKISSASLTMDDFVIQTEDGSIAATDAARAFIEEMVGAENCKQALALLQLQQMLCNENSLNTTDDINACLTLARAAGVAVESLSWLANVSAQYDAAVAAGDTVAQKNLSATMESIKAKINDEISNFRLVAVDFSGIDTSAKSAAKETKKEADIMSELNSEMDKLQSAYKSLCDIKDTYNKYGRITVDQYQELTDMGFSFLAQLVDENGQLGLNASAFERLASAKLQEMQIQMARNATDTINGLKSEAEAVEYLTYANENLRDAALGAAEAQLQSAVAAAKMRGEQQGAAAEQIYQGYQASKQMAGNVDFFFDPAALEKGKNREDKTDKLLEAYNKEKALLEHMLAMDQISKSEYYEHLMTLVKQYFEGDPEHQDQIWDVEEGYHDYLESIKETYNWIEIFLDNLAKKANALIDKASKFISWSKKNAMINRAVKATDRQITGQTNAYAYYAEKARKVGLNNSYIDKIQNGTLTMEDMQNESLSGKIEKYQEWYDRMVACEDAIGELYDQERDLIRQKLDNVLEYYNDLDSYMSSIVSKMDSFISLMDDMGKRSSLTDLLEQFSAANEQITHFQSQTTTSKKENNKDYFDSSKKVEAAKKEDADELIGTLNAEKKQVSTGVQNTGTYKKLLKDIAKAQIAYDKQYDKLWSIDPEKDKNGKKAEAAQKKLDKLSDKLDALTNKRDDLEANATANNVVAYSKLYDQYMKLYNKREALEEKGRELSAKDAAKLESLFDQMVDMGSRRDDAIKELEEQIRIADGSKKDSTEAEKLQKQIKDIGDGVKNSATYQNLEKDIDTVQAKIDKFWDTHDNATNAQQKQLDKWEAQLEAYYEKQKQLEENATADTVGEYAKVYDAWRKLQDKLDAGKVLSVNEYKNYNKYNDQLKQFAEERSSIVESLENQLKKALNPGDRITNINREYEEAAEGIYNSYQSQIDNIDAKLKASKQYQDLLAKKQNLENIRDTKGLNASQEKTLKKYTEELEALGKGGTGDNIANYIKAWEDLYKLQQKIDNGKKLSTKEAANYDSLKSQIDAWNKDKQTQISDLTDLMNDELEKLREKNAENIADAEAEINSYYSRVYELAKQIAEYNVNALKEQLAYLDAYISYYKDLVSLYDKFSGDKLSRLLTDLDEEAMADQTKVYEKYLATLQSKYDATLSEINEYKQLIDAIDTNDFEASMDLFQKAMDDYTASGNTAMAEKLQEVLKVLNDRAVDADNWEEYADLWLNEWEQMLADAKSGLIDTAGSIQDINDALREVRFSNITDALEELTRAGNILSSMSNLIQDSWLYENDGLSEYGQAKVALLVSQLENAQVAANEYLELLNRIQKNEDTYASDKAYQDALAEATQNYYDSLSNAADIENTIVDIMKKAQEEEVSNWKDIIAARKEALAAKKSYYDYDKTIKDKNKNIESLKAELAALNEVNTAEAKARKAKLEAQLKDAEDDLADTRIEHEYDLQIGALDDWAKKLEESLDDSNKSVQESLESQKKIIDEAKDLYQTATDSVNETMDKIVNFYSGMGMGIDGADLTPKGDSNGNSSAVVTPNISVNAGNSNKEIAEQSTGQITEQMRESVNALIETVKNESNGIKSGTQKLNETVKTESGEIQTSIGTPIPFDSPEFREKLINMMSDRIVPDLDRMVENARMTESYLINDNNNNQPVEINVHYDALLNVEGNVDKDALPDLKTILEKSFDYNTKRMYNDARKAGVRNTVNRIIG